MMIFIQELILSLAFAGPYYDILFLLVLSLSFAYLETLSPTTYDTSAATKYLGVFHDGI